MNILYFFSSKISKLFKKSDNSMGLNCPRCKSSNLHAVHKKYENFECRDFSSYIKVQYWVKCLDCDCTGRISEVWGTKK